MERMGRRADRLGPRARLRALQALRVRRDRPRAGRPPNGSNDILCFGGGYYPWDRRWSTTGRTARCDQAIAARHARAARRTRGPSTTARWTPAGIALDEHDASTTGSRPASPAGTRRGSGSSSTSPTTIEFGEDTRRQGALRPARPPRLLRPTGRRWWVYGESDERWKIVGGNQQIALAQADYLGARERPPRLGADRARRATRDGTVDRDVRRRRHDRRRSRADHDRSWRSRSA